MSSNKNLENYRISITVFELSQQRHDCVKAHRVTSPARSAVDDELAGFSPTYDSCCEKSDLKTVKYARTAFDNPISSASATSA